MNPVVDLSVPEVEVLEGVQVQKLKRKIEEFESKLKETEKKLKKVRKEVESFCGEIEEFGTGMLPEFLQDLAEILEMPPVNPVPLQNKEIPEELRNELYDL
jgi:hypothetical protein